MAMFWPFRGSRVKDVVFLSGRFTTTDANGNFTTQVSKGFTVSRVNASEYTLTLEEAYSNLENIMFSVQGTWPGGGASANRGNTVNLKTVSLATRTITIEIISEFDAALAAVPNGATVRISLWLKKGNA